MAGVERDGWITPERVRQVRARQVSRPSQPLWLAGLELADEHAVFCLIREIARQIAPSHQGLDVVGQQQPLRAAAALVVVHDAALEALIDEARIGRVVRRTRCRQTPDLEVEVRQQRLTTLRYTIRVSVF